MKSLGVWGAVLLLWGSSVGCAASTQQAEESKLVPAGARRQNAEKPPSTEPTSNQEASEGDAPKKRKGKRNALMRRFDQQEQEHTPVPRACDREDEKEECYPDKHFVERLCSSHYPGVALVMFNKESPWVRAYLRGPAKAWTTAPGAQQEERLAFREEVILLQSGKPAGEVQVSNGASFYALRWNGSCVKLTEEEVTKAPPWNKVTPPLAFKYFDDGQQEVLRADKKINAAYSAMKKECRGARLGNRSQKCEKLDTRLTELVASYVRSGTPLPDPERLP